VILIENYLSGFCQIVYKGGGRIKRTKIVPVRWVPDNFDSDWDGVPNYRDCEPFNPNRQDVAENIKVYPNATIGEVRKNAKDLGKDFPYGPRKNWKQYRKEDFAYNIINGSVTAMYLPSRKKPLKIMFEWISKKKKWKLLTYRKGDR